MFSEEEKKIINSLCQDLPQTLTPYKDLALQLNISEEKLFSFLKKLKEEKVYRRFASLINHYKTSFSYNALLVWQIEDKEIEKVAEVLSNLIYVSHCYQRKVYKKWPYNLYIMMHAESEKDLSSKIKEMKDLIGSSKYKILNTLQEFKKESVIYFESDLEK